MNLPEFKRIRNKVIIGLVKLPEYDNKDWIKMEILHNQDSTIFSFEELYWLLKYLVYCEDKKYDLPHQMGGGMVRAFVSDVFWTDFPYELLAIKYKIPKRGGINK